MSAWVELAVHLAHRDALRVKLVDDHLFVPEALLALHGKPYCQKTTDVAAGKLRALRYVL